MKDKHQTGYRGCTTPKCKTSVQRKAAYCQQKWKDKPRQWKPDPEYPKSVYTPAGSRQVTHGEEYGVEEMQAMGS